MQRNWLRRRKPKKITDKEFSDSLEQKEFNSKAAKALRFKHDLLTGASTKKLGGISIDTGKKSVDEVRAIGRSVNRGEYVTSPIKNVNDKINEKAPIMGNLATIKKYPQVQPLMSSRTGKPAEYIKAATRKGRKK